MDGIRQGAVLTLVQRTKEGDFTSPLPPVLGTTAGILGLPTMGKGSSYSVESPTPVAQGYFGLGPTLLTGNDALEYKALEQERRHTLDSNHSLPKTWIKKDEALANKAVFVDVDAVANDKVASLPSALVAMLPAEQRQQFEQTQAETIRTEFKQAQALYPNATYNAVNLTELHMQKPKEVISLNEAKAIIQQEKEATASTQLPANTTGTALDIKG
jgi:hypothetical protein